MARDADGDFVVVWMSFGSDGSNWGIYGQRYDSTGVAEGSEFLVNTTTDAGQLDACVAMDADGDFVVTWLSYGQDGSVYGIYGQRYNAAGVAQGTEFLVNTTTVGNQNYSNVSMDADGDFVVTWSSSNQDGSGYGVYGQRYNASGVAQGTEFQINTTTEDNQMNTAVAMNASGDFVVVWRSDGQDGSGRGVYAQRFEESTDVAGPIVTEVLDQTRPIAEGTQLVSVVPSLTVVFSEDLNVSGGSTGANSVTNPANWKITRNGVDVTGTISGITFGFNATTSKYEAVLNVSTALEDGEFEVTVRDSVQDVAGNALDGDRSGTPGGDFTRTFTSANVAAAGVEFQVNTYTTNNQIVSYTGQGHAVAMDDEGDFVVTWVSWGQDGSMYGIYAQRYNAAGVAQGSEFRVNTTTAGDQRDATVAMDADGDFVITWTSYDDFATRFNVYGQRYNAAGVAQGTQFRVNSTAANDQDSASVAMDANGNFVVAWRSKNQDGSGSGIYAQRFNADGSVDGTEFRVNTTTSGDQTFATVAMDASGDFVISWTSAGQDGDGLGVFAQCYNSAGVAQGSEFQVNTETTNDQWSSNVDMDAEGNFVITWSSKYQDGASYGVYAQRYNAAGVAQGTEFLVNVETILEQFASSIAMDSDGDFVISWTTNNQDGYGRGIFGRRFNAAGQAQGTEFQVNTHFIDSQDNSHVAINAGGNFVVAWTGNNQDGSGTGVFAQRYESNLSPVLAMPGTVNFTEGDSATAIATAITVSDLDSTTLASATVTLTSYVAGQDALAFVNDGATMGNIAVSTNASGVLTLTSAGATATLAQWQAALRAVTYENTSDTPDTTQRSVAFVVDDGTDLSNVLTSTIDITPTNDAPALAQPGDITYVENDPATAIAPAITVSDFDSAALASATVTITNFVAGQDVLGFVNDGATMGNIAISSNASGVLNLTSAGATATLAEWQAALRAITYENTSDTPITTQRSVEFVVDDGADTSSPLTSTIDITATNDAPVLAQPDSISYTENDPATAIAPAITVSDFDSAALASATVTITNFVAGQDVLGFVNDGATMGNIAISSNASGVLNLTSAGATATLAEWQAALRAVTYVNTDDAPDTTQRSVDFEVSDGTDSSSPVTSTIDITAVNDAPILAGIESNPVSYAPNAAAVFVTSTLTVSELDNTHLSGAVVQISSGYQTGDLLSFVDSPNITGSFDAQTGTLTLSGSDTLADYQAAMRSVTFVSTSTSAASRTVSFQVDDGTDLSNPVARTVGGYAQLSGGIVNVYGTQQADVITVTDTGTLQVDFNGVVSQFDSSQVTAINIFAYGGNDSVNVSSLTGNKLLTVYGGGGDDTVRVSNGVTRGVLLNGGDGADQLVGGSGFDVLIGGAGHDMLEGGEGNDTLEGGAGNDVYAFLAATSNQTDTVVELVDGGADLLNFASLTTTVTVNLTSDTSLALMAQRLVKVGAAGQSANFENVTGGSVGDSITGNAASNTLTGNGGNDTLIGGDGSDTLYGSDGNDLLKGGNQDDVLWGGIGDDALLGEAGNDRLIGGDGANALTGGLENDVYVFTPATVNQIETVYELIDGGTDTLDFTALTTAVTVNLTSDSALATMTQRIVKAGVVGQSAFFENVLGGSGNDQITGNAASNLLAGNGGNDIISGEGGNDILLGSKGNDTLKGTSGRNLLIGGVGGDLLLGGAEGDLLVSGSSTHESDPAALQALLAEWASGNTYQSRVDHLLGTTNGGANGSSTLSSTTVTNDASKDYLTGDADQDWFLADSQQDVLTDKAANEIFTAIDTWI